MAGMRIELDGRTALVTGSTGGIGFATARGLAQAGARVVLNGRSRERLDEAVRRLRADVPDAAVVTAVHDVSTAEGCQALTQAVPAVDVLVNNAGMFGPRSFFEIPDEDWMHMFEVNVLSGVRLSRHYAPGMVERGWGRIVFVSSESALNVPTAMIHYGMSKTAQLAVARGLAQHLAGTGVTVNSVLPGPTGTEGVAAMFGVDHGDTEALDLAGREFVQEHRSSSLIRRLATPEEVANMIVYVCSPLASATSGAALRVDGGVVPTIP